MTPQTTNSSLNLTLLVLSPVTTYYQIWCVVIIAYSLTMLTVDNANLTAVSCMTVAIKPSLKLSVHSLIECIVLKMELVRLNEIQ